MKFVFDNLSIENTRLQVVCVDGNNIDTNL